MGGGGKFKPGAAGKGLLEERLARIIELLNEHYPKAGISLRFRSPLELMVATILSAQCTDERVNRVTPALFSKYRTAADYARADLNVFMKEIRPTGFFRNKARSIVACARAIEARHGGRVPDSIEELVALPGIGRKTANVLLGNTFGIPGIVVDTHVKRLAGRLGLSRNSDPVKIEYDLMEIVPRRLWTLFSNQLIAHGRKFCRAPRPRCRECFLDEILCPGNTAI